MKKPFRMGRGLLATALLTAGGAIALLPSVAGASTPKPQINVVTSSAGSHTVKLGAPASAALAKLSPSYVAYAPNGDEAVSVTLGTGATHVYLIAGQTEPNEYHIATATTSHTLVYGTLIGGDAYLVAGTHASGNAGIIGFPGGGSTPGETTIVTAVTNPISPQSLSFDNSGNLLIGEALPTTGALKTAIQMVAKASCSSACPYRYTTLAAGGLYSVAGSGFTGITHTPSISFTYQVQGLGMAVDSAGNIIDGGGGLVVFLNETTLAITRYNKHLATHKATVIAGTTAGTGTCGGGASTPSTGVTAPNLQWPRPTIDASGNVYINDNRGTGADGCTWVLPAATGTFHGTHLTVGHLYSLTGATTTTPAATNAVAKTAGIKNASAVVPDKAGNVVIAQGGTTPKVWVVAESTTVWYGVSMTKGHIYSICGGGTITTTPTTCTKFKFAGLARSTHLPNHGLTSLAQGKSGHLLLTNGSTATNGAAYTVSNAPTGQATAVITSVTPNSGSTHGHTAVTIHGRNLGGASSVTFGGTAATGVTNVAGHTTTEVSATTAAHTPAGLVTVTVVASLGTGTKATAFTYVGPAATSVVLQVTPAGGAYINTTVTLTARATPSNITGKVLFQTGTTTIGTVAVSSGTAHLVHKFTVAGHLTLKATFTPTTQTNYGVSPTASQAYVVSTKVTGGTVSQPFSETVKPGLLTLNCTVAPPGTTLYNPHAPATNYPATGLTADNSERCAIINFPTVTLNGHTHVVTSTMNPVWVLTARGNPNAGWALSASMVPTSTTINPNTHCATYADFCDATFGADVSNVHGQIAAKNLTLEAGYACTPTTVTPHTHPYNPASLTHGSFGRAGPAILGTGWPGTNPLTPPVSGHNRPVTATGQYYGTMALCQAPHGTSGGIFKVSGSKYKLTVPSNIYKGTYYGTVMYTLVSTPR